MNTEIFKDYVSLFCYLCMLPHGIVVLWVFFRTLPYAKYKFAPDNKLIERKYKTYWIYFPFLVPQQLEQFKC